MKHIFMIKYSYLSISQLCNIIRQILSVCVCVFDKMIPLKAKDG